MLAGGSCQFLVLILKTSRDTKKLNFLTLGVLNVGIMNFGCFGFGRPKWCSTAFGHSDRKKGA
jgi:hypothetical protein